MYLLFLKIDNNEITSLSTDYSLLKKGIYSKFNLFNDYYIECVKPFSFIIGTKVESIETTI